MPPKTPLFDTEQYFEEHRDPIIPGIGVFVLYIVGSAILVYLIIQLLIDHSRNVPPAAIDALNGMIVTLTIFAIPVALVSLLLVAGLMHFWVTDRETYGSFGAALAVAAWSYAPEVLSLPVEYALAWLHFRGRTFDASDPEQFTAQADALMAGMDLSGILVSLVVVGWSVIILTRGIAATHDVDPNKALTPALIIGVVSFALRFI